MALLVKLGRALLALFFIISAWQQLVELRSGRDLTASFVGPKSEVIAAHTSSTLEAQLPRIGIKLLIAVGIVLKGIGGMLFACGSSIGAYLLLLYMGVIAPLLHFFDDRDDIDAIRSMILDLAISGLLFCFVEIDGAMLDQQIRRRFP